MKFTRKTTEPLIRKLAFTDFKVTEPNESYPVDGLYEFTIVGKEAVLATSRLEDYPDYVHAPVLDIDVPHYLIPSSTEGHSHLYIDVPVEWDKYVTLLEALSDCGIIEEGYKNASLSRGFTAVRLPHIKKNS